MYEEQKAQIDRIIATIPARNGKTLELDSRAAKDYRDDTTEFFAILEDFTKHGHSVSVNEVFQEFKKRHEAKEKEGTITARVKRIQKILSKMKGVDFLMNESATDIQETSQPDEQPSTQEQDLAMSEAGAVTKHEDQPEAENTGAITPNKKAGRKTKDASGNLSNIKIIVYVTEELHSDITAIADIQGFSVSQILFSLMQDYINSAKNTPEIKELLELKQRELFLKKKLASKNNNL